MFSPGYSIRWRLEMKFGVKFSVTANVRYFGKTYTRIKWAHGPSVLQVSLAIRDFNFNKLYAKGDYLYDTEEHKTPSELRK